MRPSRHDEIRHVLLSSEDGLTILQLANLFNCQKSSMLRSLKDMWGVYIDRWQPANGTYAAVYMSVSTPENAPHPRK
jgi:hypothetical protein